MPPIDLYSSWSIRPTDSQEKFDPLKRYFFICEGANTETWYFKHLIDIKREVGIHSLIDIVLLEKTEDERNVTYPQHLITLALENKNKLVDEGKFDENSDKLIILFDTDIFKRTHRNLEDFLNIQNDFLIFGLTNPDFELFLLLHIENAVIEIIKPNEEELFNNVKIGNQRPCYKYLLEKTKLNSKKNEKIGELASKIDLAIKQEKLINQDLNHCLNKLTSNIASIIEKIKEEKLPSYVKEAS